MEKTTMIHTGNVAVVDGGCRYNGTNKAQCYGSFKLYVDNKEVYASGIHKFRDAKTNNQAEYEAMIQLLNYLTIKEEYCKLHWIIRTDSTLIRKQIQGHWNVSDKMKPYCTTAQRLVKELSCEIEYLNNLIVKQILGH